MTKLYQYKTRDPHGSYAWLHTELYGSIEELKHAHPLDPEPEWREVYIVSREELHDLEILAIDAMVAGRSIYYDIAAIKGEKKP